MTFCPWWSYLLKICLLVSLQTLGMSSGWTQFGNSIVGEASNSHIGSSISMLADGSRIAIGAPGHDGNSGQVLVFDISTDHQWVQVGSSIKSEAASDLFGYSVALSADGSRIVVGAISNGGSGFNAGHARVFALTDGDWVQLGVDIDGSAANDAFGYAVDINADGDRVAIGAPYNGANGQSAGHVRVFRLVSSTWTQLGGDVEGPTAHAALGLTVCLNRRGSRLVTGAPGVNMAITGSVYIYDYVSLNWVQFGQPILGIDQGDFFGSSLALSSLGGRIAVGARLHNGGNGALSGLVQMFDSISGGWVQVGSNIYGISSNDNCGYSVALSTDGTSLVISLPGRRGPAGADSGLVKLYRLDDSVQDWRQLHGDIFGSHAGERAGNAIAVSRDGKRVAVGARESDTGGINSGSVRVYIPSNVKDKEEAFRFYIVIIVCMVACPLITIVFCLILLTKWKERRDRMKMHITDTEDVLPVG